MKLYIGFFVFLIFNICLTRANNATITIEEACTCDPVVEREALESLYYATDGENWTNTWDLSQPMDTWYGVTLNPQGGVTALELSGELSCSGAVTDGNNMVGTLPPELGNLSELRLLCMSFNQLTGSIPTELGNLENLEELSLWGNQFSGAIPSELGNLSNLTILFLGQNELSGQIPPELGNLTQLFGLAIDNNNLTGSIPEELTTLDFLTILNIPFNQLSGEIPAGFATMPNLSVFHLHDNQLSGCFPDEFDLLCDINYNLNNNAALPWQGDMEQWCNGENQIGAPCDDSDATTENDVITEDCGCMGTPVLMSCADSDRAALIALYNAAGGENWLNNENWLEPDSDIGTWYGVTTNADGCVIELDLYNNILIGSLPVELGDLSSLTKLQLSSNQLNGNIPSEIGNLANLIELYLDSNEFSGSIPTEVGNLTNLTHLYLYNNQLTNDIPSSIGNLSNLTHLLLLNNHLKNSIPVEIGNLSNLIALNLSNNDLTGSIPPQLGGLSSLTDLFLSDNQLSDDIPLELAQLSTISTLNLSNNLLSGCFSPEFHDAFCSINEYNFTNNPDLPGGGDFDAFCLDGTGACENTTLRFIINDACAGLGSTIQVPVTTENFSNVNGFQFSVFMDPNFATITGLSGFGLQNWDSNDFTIDAANGILTLTREAVDVFAGESVADGTVLFYIEAEVIGTPNNTYVGQIQGNPTPIVVTQNLEDVTPELVSGSLCVLNLFNIQGNIYTYYNDPINESLVIGFNGGSYQATTDINGFYNLANVDDFGALTLTPIKNPNTLTNGVDINDVIAIKRHLLEELLLTSPYQIIAGEVSGDDVLSVLDLIFIKQAIRLEIDHFPIEKSWRFIPHDHVFPNLANPFELAFPATRVYDPFNMNYENQDFIGVKVGDVTGNVDSSL